MSVQLDAFAKDRPPISVRYQQWASTPDGRRFLDEVRLLVLDAAERKPRRIELNLIYASVRASMKVTANNDYRAIVARELVARYPHLAPMIELRNAPKSEAAA